MNIEGLKQIDVYPCAIWPGIASAGTSEIGRARLVRECPADAAHQLELGGVAAGLGQRSPQLLQLGRSGRAERVEATAVADEAPQQCWVQRLTAEPHARSLGTEGLGLEVDVGEREVLARMGRGRVSPGGRHRLQLLVENGAAPVERHAERLVLLLVPADGRLHDQSALAEEVERRQLLGEQQRMPQRIDHRGQRDAQVRGGRGDGGREHERVGPGRGGVLVARRGVVARVAHDPARPRGRAQHDVLAEHDGVDAGRLGLDGDAHECAEVTR